MKDKQYKLTPEETNLVNQIIGKTSPELLDIIRSVLHSSAIKKGYSQPRLVLDSMSQVDGIVKGELEVCIPFLNIEVPQDYTQSSYTVDVWVETKDTIFLVDPKGIGHNHNTPVSDEVTKWTMAKQEVQILNPHKKVRFILLKPDDVNEYEFIRLKKSYQDFGLELHKTDVFLSDFIGKETTVSNILKEHKDNLMRESLKKLVTI